MKIKNSKIKFFTLISFFLILFTVEATAQQTVENDAFRLHCDKPAYTFIAGTSNAYCNVTVKKNINIRDFNVTSFLQFENGVKIEKIYIRNSSGGWEDMTTGEVTKGKKANAVNTKFKIKKGDVKEFNIEFYAPSTTISDEFSFTIKDKIDYLELDPPISGCDDTDPNTFECDTVSVTGNSIDTSKNIRIISSTLDGATGNLLRLNSTNGWIQINRSTVKANGDGNNIMRIFANKEIIMNGSVIALTGDAECTGTHSLIMNSTTETITLTGIDSEVYGTTCGTGGGGSAFFELYAETDGKDIIINNSRIRAHGGRGTSDSGSAEGGACTTLVKAGGNLYFTGNIDIFNWDNVSTWECYGGSATGDSGHSATGGNSNVRLEADKIFFDGYGVHKLTTNWYRGIAFGLASNTNGNAFNTLLVEDEIFLSRSTSFSNTGENVANNSIFNFSDSVNIKLLMWNFTQIVTPEIYVHCPNAENLNVYWNNSGGTDPNIVFNDCSYTNISLDSFVDAESPTFSNFENNGSTARYNDKMRWTIDITDISNIDYYIVAHNITGTLINETPIDTTGNSFTVTYNWTVNVTRGINVCLQYWFNDTFGFENQTTFSCFTVANTIPTTPEIFTPTNLSSTADNYTIITFNSTDPDNATDTQTHYIYGDTNTNPTTLVFNGSGDVNTRFNWTNLNDGTYYIKVQTDDGISNSSNSSIISFVVSSLLPAINLINPSNNEFLAIRNISFNFSVTDSDGIGTCTLWHNVSGTWQENRTTSDVVSGTHYQFNQTNLLPDESEYIYNINCSDGAGNDQFFIQNLTFSVDTVKPNVTVISPTNGAIFTSLSVNLFRNESDFSLATCQFDFTVGGATSPNKTIDCQNNYVINFTSRDDYVFHYYAIDSSGNINTTTINFTITTADGVISTGLGGGAISDKDEDSLKCNKTIKWTVLSEGNKERIDLFLKTGTTKPAETTIKLTNTGFKNLTINLECTNTGNKTFCENVNLTETEILLEPNIFEAKEFPVFLATPNSSKNGDQFTFSIISDDGSCFQSLSVFAMVPTRFSILGRFIRIGALELQLFATSLIVGFLVFVLLFSVFRAFDLPILAWVLGILGGIGTFAGMFFFL